MDAKAAGKGKVTCTVLTPNGMELDMDVTENPDGTFDIYYTAPEPGKYVITIRFGGQHIPKSPFQVMVSDITEQVCWTVYHCHDNTMIDRATDTDTRDITTERDLNETVVEVVERQQQTV